MPKLLRHRYPTAFAAALVAASVGIGPAAAGGGLDDLIDQIGEVGLLEDGLRIPSSAFGDCRSNGGTATILEGGGLQCETPDGWTIQCGPSLAHHPCWIYPPSNQHPAPGNHATAGAATAGTLQIQR